ncbi:MAG: DUF2157 domain-containing protein [Dehalococcoidia bacterium]|jgi:uncharacterized membrane protein|nr:DUF2157 domain-containing protein [Dehalococcoidia bacterium]
MKTDGKDDDFLERLRGEVSSWHDERIIDAATETRILSRYRVGRAPRQDEGRLNRLVLILSVAGGLLAGLGVMLTVASNWTEMARLTKVTLLLTTLLAVQGGGFWLRYRRGMPSVAAGVVLMVSLIFGGAVFLAGQAYHVPANEPYLYLLWGLGSIPIAYAAGSRPTLILSTLVLIAWYVSLLGRWDVDFISGPSTLALFALGAMILWAGETQGSAERTRPFAPVLTTTGLIVSMFLIFMLAHVEIWRGIDDPDDAASFGNEPTAFALSLGVIVVSAVTLIAAGLWRRRDSRVVVAQAVGTVGAFSFMAVMFLTTPFSDGASYAIMFNGLAVAMIVWAVVVGLWSQREAFVNTGLAFAGLLILARYLDLSFTLFDRSLVFIGGGLVLIGAAYGLERARKLLLAPGSTEPPGEEGHPA